MLADKSVKDFLAQTAGNDPVPGGGSISALCAATGSALARMVASLTLGREKYKQNEERVEEIANKLESYRTNFLQFIDKDADAYHQVYQSFQLPRETDEQKKARSEQIQQTTIYAAEVPLQIAQEAYDMMDLIEDIATLGNQNAITDAGVAIMATRTAVLGAILNVRINLGSIKDEAVVKRMSAQIEELEKSAKEREAELLKYVNSKI